MQIWLRGWKQKPFAGGLPPANGFSGVCRLLVPRFGQARRKELLQGVVVLCYLLTDRAPIGSRRKSRSRQPVSHSSCGICRSKPGAFSAGSSPSPVES